jgi:hypothetical protein
MRWKTRSRKPALASVPTQELRRLIAESELCDARYRRRAADAPSADERDRWLTKLAVSHEVLAYLWEEVRARDPDVEQ